jgi:hypothetical protein
MLLRNNVYLQNTRLFNPEEHKLNPEEIHILATDGVAKYAITSSTPVSYSRISELLPVVN